MNNSHFSTRLNNLRSNYCQIPSSSTLDEMIRVIDKLNGEALEILALIAEKNTTKYISKEIISKFIGEVEDVSKIVKFCIRAFADEPHRASIPKDISCIEKMDAIVISYKTIYDELKNISLPDTAYDDWVVVDNASAVSPKIVQSANPSPPALPPKSNSGNLTAQKFPPLPPRGILPEKTGKKSTPLIYFTEKKGEENNNNVFLEINNYIYTSSKEDVDSFFCQLEDIARNDLDFLVNTNWMILPLFFKKAPTHFFSYFYARKDLRDFFGLLVRFGFIASFKALVHHCPSNKSNNLWEKQFNSEEEKSLWKNYYDESLLFQAIDSGSVEVINELWALCPSEKKPLLWQANYYGENPFFRSIETLNHLVVEQVWNICPENNKLDSLENKKTALTPLSRAITLKTAEIIILLIKIFPSNLQKKLWKKNGDCLTPLHQAIEHGRVDILKILWERCPDKLKAKQWRRDLHGNTLLHTAIDTGKENLVDYILEICPVNLRGELTAKNFIGKTACELLSTRDAGLLQEKIKRAFTLKK